MLLQRVPYFLSSLRYHLRQSALRVNLGRSCDGYIRFDRAAIAAVLAGSRRHVNINSMFVNVLPLTLSRT